MISEVLPSQWRFPSPESADPDGLLAVGGDLEPGTLLVAYRAGVFPMPVDRMMAWWSPHPRAVLPLDAFHVSRSLQRSRRKYRGTFDTAFAAVVDGCADPDRPHGWITSDIRNAYVRLHELGWAHSSEVWTEDGDLAGGVYGVAIGAFFAAESMFYRARDASKVALLNLVDKLRRDGVDLFDCQWQTPHLQSLGVVEIPRTEYLRRLSEAVNRPEAWS